MRFAAGGVLALLFGPSYVLAGDVCDNFKPCLPTKWITDIGTFDCVRNGGELILLGCIHHPAMP